MEIKNLKDTSLSAIVECLLEAFSGYFVKMPSDPDYWANRFRGARVDYELSFGAFDDGKLVGFIINGIDVHNGELTAFNTGTGVLPEHRSQGIVDRLYDFALPHFREKGIEKCMLEVIRGNDRAVRVYERIGFRIQRELKCYTGCLQNTFAAPAPQKTDFEKVLTCGYPDDPLYSWDNSGNAIRASGDLYTSYIVKDQAERPVGYFSINEKSGYLARLYAGKGQDDLLLQAIAAVSGPVKINNIDTGRKDLLFALGKAGLENHIDQYEMIMRL